MCDCTDLSEILRRDFSFILRFSSSFLISLYSFLSSSASLSNVICKSLMLLWFHSFRTASSSKLWNKIVSTAEEKETPQNYPEDKQWNFRFIYKSVQSPKAEHSIVEIESQSAIGVDGDWEKINEAKMFHYYII